MKNNIEKQLMIIEKSNAWINSYLEGEKQKNAYRTIVNFRRKLNKKKFALADNPAAAMYGESQVGKSYLISSLLSEQEKPFGIIDEKGIFHNFIEEINPPGGGSESTSLVSRFSVKYKPQNIAFPIKAVLLSPADIIMVLCDSYYNDIKVAHESALSIEQINAEINIINKNRTHRQIEQVILCEDDVLEIQDYFNLNFSTKASSITDSEFFKEISLLISKIRPTEWGDVFSLLWNKNKFYTELFIRLIKEHESLKFTNIAYIPIDAVLYKKGTLLDVKRLKDIYIDTDAIESEYEPDTEVLLCLDNKKEEKVTIAKSVLCVLCAELVFSQPEELLVKKPFLEGTDLLDFPGARSRLTLPEEKIEAEIMPELLLRGKVAYLFNKYSEAEKINILLFCAKHEQAAQRSMPEILNNWIMKTVGKIPEKRELFINNSKIPPLFIIGTFFNVNLQYDPLLDKPNERASFNYRWNQRFERTLAEQLLNTEIYDWFINWTSSQPNFQNIYLLRDFEKSDSVSHIFRGYNKSKKEIEEIIPEQYPNFRSDLRESFINFPFVKRHFTHPEESWDSAASINEDGTRLIIDNLTIAAKNINIARTQKHRSDLNELSQSLLMELKKYFHSNDKDEELLKAKRKAGDIQLKLDTAFRADGIKFFGQMMQEFMLDESTVYKLYRDKIDDIERRDIINMDTYSTYRMQVPVLENDTTEKYFQRLCSHYEKTTPEQIKDFKEKLQAERVDLDELIKGNTNRIKNFSQQLAETLLIYWSEYITQKDKYVVQRILASNDSSALQDIVEMFQKLFKKLHLDKIVAEKIRNYIDGYNKTESAYEMVADISAEILNKCINTIGLEYLSESDIDDLKQANERNSLGLKLQKEEVKSTESITALFEKIENLPQLMQANPDTMKSLPSYYNYMVWYNRLKVGFISVCDIPNYDIHANEKLGTIINDCKIIKY